MRSIQQFSLPGFLLLTLAACGGSPESPQADPGTQAAAATARGSTSEAAMPALRCPPRLAGTAPDGPDIIGLRLGMSHADALALVRCHTKDEGHLDLPVRWFDRMETFGIGLGPQAISVMTGDTEECSFSSFSDMQRCGPGNRVWLHTAESITVATPGLPGKEAVVGIWRTQQFRENEMPPAEAVYAALMEKYGAPQGSHRQSDRHEVHTWDMTVNGEPLTAQHPVYHQCTNSGVRPRGTDSQSWTEGCGLSIKAMLIRSRTNADLVEEISVGMLDQQRLWDHQKAFEQGLRDIDAERRRQELDRAKDTTNVQL